MSVSFRIDPGSVDEGIAAEIELDWVSDHDPHEVFAKIFIFGEDQAHQEARAQEVAIKTAHFFKELFRGVGP